MMKNKHLKVATFFCPPFSYWDGSCRYDTRYTNNTCVGEPDGIENRVLSVLSEMLGFTYNLENVLEIYKNYNYSPPNAVMISIANGTADLGYCGLWLTDFLSEDLEPLPIWNQLCVTFLVPEPEIVESRWNILRPFTASTWSFILVTAVAVSVVAFKLSRRHFGNTVDREKRQQEPYSSYFLGIICVTLGIAIPGIHTRYTSNPVRIVSIAWSFSSLILTTFYTMNLASFLTLPYYEPKINTLDDLIRLNFTWGTPTPPINDEYEYMLDINTEAGRVLATRFEVWDDLEKQLRTRKYAIPVLRGDSYYFPFQRTKRPLSVFKGMRLMSEKPSCYYLQMVTEKNSLFSSPLKIAMLKVFELGIFSKIRTDVFIRQFRSGSIRKIEESVRQTASESPWGFTNLIGTFTVLTNGWIISVGIFFMEKLIYRCLRKKF